MSFHEEQTCENVCFFTRFSEFLHDSIVDPPLPIILRLCGGSLRFFHIQSKHNFVWSKFFRFLFFCFLKYFWIDFWFRLFKKFVQIVYFTDFSHWRHKIMNREKKSIQKYLKKQKIKNQENFDHTKLCLLCIYRKAMQ